MRTNGGLECSSHPISCWQCDLSFPRHTILCDFDVQMNNDNQEDKKKKIHLIFLCSCLPPPVYCFTDSRICYWIFLGNNSSLFTGSAGGTIASHSLNSDFFFPCLFVFFHLQPSFSLPFPEHTDIPTSLETKQGYQRCARIKARGQRLLWVPGLAPQ